MVLFLLIKSHFSTLSCSISKFFKGSLSAARRAAAFVRGDAVIHKLFTELAYRYKWILNLLLFFFCYSLLWHIDPILCVTEIEQVDILDCFELAYELVMLHQWPILSKTTLYFANCKLFVEYELFKKKKKKKRMLLGLWPHWRATLSYVFKMFGGTD